MKSGILLTLRCKRNQPHSPPVTFHHLFYNINSVNTACHRGWGFPAYKSCIAKKPSKRNFKAGRSLSERCGQERCGHRAPWLGLKKWTSRLDKGLTHEVSPCTVYIVETPHPFVMALRFPVACYEIRKRGWGKLNRSHKLNHIFYHYEINMRLKVW